MSREEQAAYRRYLDDRVILADQIYTARGEGHLEGKAEGREEGRAEGRAEGREEGRAEGRVESLKEVAKKMKQMGMPDEVITQATGLDTSEI